MKRFQPFCKISHKMIWIRNLFNLSSFLICLPSFYLPLCSTPLFDLPLFLFFHLILYMCYISNPPFFLLLHCLPQSPCLFLSSVCSRISCIQYLPLCLFKSAHVPLLHYCSHTNTCACARVSLQTQSVLHLLVHSSPNEKTWVLLKKKPRKVAVDTDWANMFLNASTRANMHARTHMATANLSTELPVIFNAKFRSIPTEQHQ